MKRVAMMAVLAAGLAGAIAGCERSDLTKVYDPSIDGVAQNKAPAVDLSLLEDQAELYRTRTRGSGGSGAIAPAPSPAPASAPGATAAGGAPASATNKTPGSETPAPPPGDLPPAPPPPE